MDDFNTIREQWRQLFADTAQFSPQCYHLLDNVHKDLQHKYEDIAALASQLNSQITVRAKMLKGEEIRRKKLKRVEVEMEDWEQKRAMHLNIQRERNRHLSKTLELLRRNQLKIEGHLQGIQQENSKIDEMDEYQRQQEGKERRKRKELNNQKNRPLRRGVEGDLEEGLIKITVERESKKDISIGGPVEYVMRLQKQIYVPGEDYPQPIQEALREFNFHWSIDKLKKDLSRLSGL